MELQKALMGCQRSRKCQTLYDQPTLFTTSFDQDLRPDLLLLQSSYDQRINLRPLIVKCHLYCLFLRLQSVPDLVLPTKWSTLVMLIPELALIWGENAQRWASSVGLHRSQSLENTDHPERNLLKAKNTNSVIVTTFESNKSGNLDVTG
jgi:hypothetical protein